MKVEDEWQGKKTEEPVTVMIKEISNRHEVREESIRGGGSISNNTETQSSGGTGSWRETRRRRSNSQVSICSSNSLVIIKATGLEQEVGDVTSRHNFCWLLCL